MRENRRCSRKNFNGCSREVPWEEEITGMVTGDCKEMTEKIAQVLCAEVAVKFEKPEPAWRKQVEDKKAELLLAFFGSTNFYPFVF